MDSTVYTIGHSNHPLDCFLSLLVRHEITAVADVRSYPQSRTNPQFDRDNLAAELATRKIAYVFLGKELGGRGSDQSCYVDGRIQYDFLAETAVFHEGITRIQRGMDRYNIALMCAEGEPLECHRSILVSRYLRQLRIPVKHILKDGRLEDHDDSMERLVRMLNLNENLLNRNKEDLLLEGYRIQGRKIAYELTGVALRNHAHPALPSRQ